MRRHKCPLVFLLSILNIDAFSSVHQEEREREMLVKDKQQKRWWVAYFSCHFSKGEMQVNLVFIMAEDWTGTYWAAINHEFHHGLSRFSYWPEWPSLLPLLLHSLSLLPFLLSLSPFVCYPLALYFYLKLYDRYFFVCALRLQTTLTSQTPTTCSQDARNIINISHNIMFYDIIGRFGVKIHLEQLAW